MGALDGAREAWTVRRGDLDGGAHSSVWLIN